jgi:hypothetical protein
VDTQSENVTVLEEQGQSALVEKKGRRVYVPKSEVQDGKVEDVVLDAGIPHGLPFEKMVNVQIDNAALVKALRDMGVYTKDDFMRNFGAIQKRFHRAMDAELKKLIQEVEANG